MKERLEPDLCVDGADATTVSLSDICSRRLCCVINSVGCLIACRHRLLQDVRKDCLQSVKDRRHRDVCAITESAHAKSKMKVGTGNFAICLGIPSERQRNLEQVQICRSLQTVAHRRSTIGSQISRVHVL